MSTWSLQDIRTKVRRVTGRLSPNEISDSKLDDYINRFYQYTFPAELKLEKKHTFYEFLTTENQAFYAFPETTFTNFEPPAYMDLIRIDWFQDPTTFIQQNFYNISSVVPWTGDGSTVLFSTSVTGFPIMPGTLVITDETEVFEDTSQTWTEDDVILTGSLGGSATINYSTGSVSVTFNTAPANAQNITLSYQLFTPGRPTAVLAYNSQFEFYPPPNTAYRFRIKAYSIVSALTAASDTPELEEWGPCIAYGASRDLHSDFGEFDAYAEVTQLYKEQLAYVLTRTEQSLLNTRSAPMF